ncbi:MULTISPECIES: RrF2 family transcriptional regulator [Halanaerobium]|jgi:Rrf2 family protein|uniref:Transcriptional regulator, BadM/Rrf2 family n=1 Tax=Halanaerobium kushneri TaxID=56779 RepID=A0A1N6YMZ0_9FIRM|nr:MULTISPECIES: Rrf2 family transcriptional regulator [Halanaerobium]RCW57478.1 BadM/Rrf2 family transcriptional regulator [Halanaerobium sp. ST460_2HS_T2]SIR15983.1 transcriptional regulator, BadM/Rrf2 family [Halanaerobium kushneri]
MEISTQGRYGVRALIDLAVHAGTEAVSLREISERQNISERYLEQIFADLKKAGLIRSVRGAHGGYLLNRPPEKISLADILNILEGKIAPEVQIQDDQSEEVVFKTVSQEIWQRLERGMHNLMESITLADLKQRIREVQKEKSEGHMYYI